MPTARSDKYERESRIAPSSLAVHSIESTNLPTVARHSIGSLQRLELLHSLDVTLFTLFVLSYLLSPSHFLTLILRLTSQVQFGSPRLVHPTRSLRFFLIAWTVVNASATVVHGLEGSSGAKGHGWAQRGVVLDFVGQAHIPSTLHLLALDFLIAALQLVLLILAFGEPVNANIASSAAVIVAPELAHDYSALLGPGWGAEDSDGEDEEEDDRPRVQSRRKSSISSTISEPPTPPMIDITFSALWNEVRPGGVRRRGRPEEEEEDGLLGMEEGRAVG